LHILQSFVQFGLFALFNTSRAVIYKNLLDFYTK